MDLTDKIKQLEAQLELQKAYSSISVGFGKGNKFPEEVKNKIRAEITAFCAKLAAGINPEEESETSNIDSVFSEEEVEALKMLAHAAISRSGAPRSKSGGSTIKEVAKAQRGEQPLMAALVTTDSVRREQRSKVSSNTPYQVIKMNDNEVVLKTDTGMTVLVPKEDIEIVTNETPEGGS